MAERNDWDAFCHNDAFQEDLGELDVTNLKELFIPSHTAIDGRYFHCQ